MDIGIREDLWLYMTLMLPAAIMLPDNRTYCRTSILRLKIRAKYFARESRISPAVLRQVKDRGSGWCRALASDLTVSREWLWTRQLVAQESPSQLASELPPVVTVTGVSWFHSW